MVSKRLGKSIQELRQQQGLTQDDLSDRASLAYSTLAKIERGAIKNPSIFTISEIAKGLGITIDDLLNHMNGEEKITTEPSSKEIKFIYFDVNGVLIKNYQKAFVSISKMVEASPEKIETYFWHYNDIAERGNMTNAEFDKLLQEKFDVKGLSWTKHYMAAVEPIEPMQKLIKQISKQWPVGLLTNIFPKYVQDLIKRGKLPDLTYKAIVDSPSVHAVKPEHKIYEVAEMKAKVKPSEILFIDDTRINITAAEKQGWKVLLFDTLRPESSVERIRETLDL